MKQSNDHPSFWRRLKARLVKPFRGDEGSIFWFIGLAFTTLKEFISGVNSWLAARRAEKNND